MVKQLFLWQLLGQAGVNNVPQRMGNCVGALIEEEWSWESLKASVRVLTFPCWKKVGFFLLLRKFKCSLNTVKTLRNFETSFYICVCKEWFIFQEWVKGKVELSRQIKTKTHHHLSSGSAFIFFKISFVLFSGLFVLLPRSQYRCLLT
jgi:hypothetical protein